MRSSRSSSSIRKPADRSLNSSSRASTSSIRASVGVQVVGEGDSFADDLNADSLALIELVEALEEEFSERSAGFRIDDDDLEDLKTVRDAVDYVVSRLG